MSAVGNVRWPASARSWCRHRGSRQRLAADARGWQQRAAVMARGGSQQSPAALRCSPCRRTKRGAERHAARAARHRDARDDQRQNSYARCDEKTPTIERPQRNEEHSVARTDARSPDERRWMSDALKIIALGKNDPAKEFFFLILEIDVLSILRVGRAPHFWGYPPEPSRAIEPFGHASPETMSTPGCTRAAGFCWQNLLVHKAEQVSRRAVAPPAERFGLQIRDTDPGSKCGLRMRSYRAGRVLRG